jgi:hypothetical protein
MSQRLLLGPQRPVTNLRDIARPEGPIAVISAGWQEAEGDIDDIHELVETPLIDLKLYHRAEEIFAADTRLHALYRGRQERLIELQHLYRMRLRQLMLAARQLRRADAEPQLLAAEQRHAISQLRALDRHHLQRIESIHAEFEDSIAAASAAVLAEHSAAIEKTMAACSTVLITGGNVAVLLNRMRLFGVHRMLPNRPVIAWSAGAMVLGHLIVLYHDRTPQGRRDPEVLSLGAGVLPGHIFLPDAQRRLKMNDAVRIGLFSKRFAPAQCVTLDSGSSLEFAGTQIQATQGVGCLMQKGNIKRLRST